MPLPLIKLYLIVKIIKFPAVALVDTFREYRRKEKVREGDREVIRERHFFHHPIKALCDRRFWVKGFTNFAEIAVHIAALFAWSWHLLLRLRPGAFVLWRPHHTH